MPHSKSNRENNGGKLRVDSIRYALGYRVGGILLEVLLLQSCIGISALFIKRR